MCKFMFNVNEFFISISVFMSFQGALIFLSMFQILHHFLISEMLISCLIVCLLVFTSWSCTLCFWYCHMRMRSRIIFYNTCVILFRLLFNHIIFHHLPKVPLSSCATEFSGNNIYRRNISYASLQAYDWCT